MRSCEFVFLPPIIILPLLLALMSSSSPPPQVMLLSKVTAVVVVVGGESVLLSSSLPNMKVARFLVVVVVVATTSPLISPRLPPCGRMHRLAGGALRALAELLGVECACGDSPLQAPARPDDVDDDDEEEEGMMTSFTLRLLLLVTRFEVLEGWLWRREEAMSRGVRARLCHFPNVVESCMFLTARNFGADLIFLISISVLSLVAPPTPLPPLPWLRGFTTRGRRFIFLARAAMRLILVLIRLSFFTATSRSLVPGTPGRPNCGVHMPEDMEGEVTISVTS